MKPVFAALLMTVLSACAPMLAPRGLTSDTPAIESDYFLTRDGLKLPLREWQAKDPRVVIVALHGMSDYSEAFDLPAPFLADHGITVYAYDQRGFGHAPDPGIWAGSEIMRHDLTDAVAAARARDPGLPVFALGESMGGAVVLSSLADPDPPKIDGAILVAPAVWSREDMPLSYRVALWLTAHTVPWLKVSGEGLHIWPSDNIDMLRMLSRDPVYQHSARADQVWGLVNLMDDARDAPAKLKDPPPILFLYGAKDQVIPAAPTKAVISALDGDATVHEYPNGYHMLLRDLSRAAPLDDIVTWVDAHAR